MNGKPIDWSPANALENTEWRPGGMLSAAYADRDRREKRRKFVLQMIHLLFVIGLLGAFFLLLCGPAEARQRFVQRSSSPCANGQCAIQKQQAVVVHHAQPVVAAQVVHHAAPVVHQQAVAVPNIHTQNNWYAVGQPLVQHSQLVAAARDAVAEQQFKATVNGSFSATVNGAGQALYQQQAPVYQQPAPQPQWTPPAEPQPPAEPDAPPTFSMTAPPTALQACGKCHANGASKGDFALEGMTGDQLWAAIDRIKEGSMPPGNPLSAAAKEAVAKEFLSLKQ
jgi:hypothetical protein